MIFHDDNIEDWLRFQGIEKYELRLNPTTFTYIVDVTGNVNLQNRGLTELPVHFGRVTGSFDISENNWISLKGLPTYINNNFYYNTSNAHSIFDVPILPPLCVNGSFSCKGVKSLHNIHKTFHHLIVRNGFDTNANSHFLGLLLIPGISNVSNFVFSSTQIEIIINKYLEQDYRDIHACQEELIQAGFAEYAKL